MLAARDRVFDGDAHARFCVEREERETIRAEVITKRSKRRRGGGAEATGNAETSSVRPRPCDPRSERGVDVLAATTRKVEQRVRGVGVVARVEDRVGGDGRITEGGAVHLHDDFDVRVIDGERIDDWRGRSNDVELKTSHRRERPHQRREFRRQYVAGRASVVVDDGPRAVTRAHREDRLDLRDLLYFASLILAWLTATAVAIDLKKAD